MGGGQRGRGASRRRGAGYRARMNRLVVMSSSEHRCYGSVYDEVAESRRKGNEEERGLEIIDALLSIARPRRPPPPPWQVKHRGASEASECQSLKVLLESSLSASITRQPVVIITKKAKMYLTSRQGAERQEYKMMRTKGVERSARLVARRLWYKRRFLLAGGGSTSSPPICYSCLVAVGLGDGVGVGGALMAAAVENGLAEVRDGLGLDVLEDLLEAGHEGAGALTDLLVEVAVRRVD